MTAKFVILSAPRTGSTLLVKTLNTVPGICCHGELFLPKHVRGLEDGFDALNATPEQRQARATELLRARESDQVEFIANALNRPGGAVGLKIIYEDLLKPRWRTVLTWMLEQPDMHFIHLVRDNALRRYISERVMQEGGAIHSGMGGGSKRKVQVSIDPLAFEGRCKEIALEAQRVERALVDKPILQVQYESLAKNLPSSVANICRFLGMEVSELQVEPALQKVGHQDLQAAVLNYQELLDHPVTRPYVLME